MPDTPDKFYLTTPIYYVNARPHIGHAYSTIVADVLARRHRLLGDDTFFLTGTDEHGQKVQRSAEAAGIPPQQFTDEVSATFRGLWDRMGITYDGYIRTTDECHKRGVQKLWRVLEERGDIYLSSYTGQYCVSDEAFVDVPVGAPCPDCGRITETITEENYFFRLSAYQEKLIELIESGTLHIQPDSVRNEVLSFVRGNVDAVLRETHKGLEGVPDYSTPEGFEAAEQQGLISGRIRESTEEGMLYVPGALKDLSISRTTFDWGIPVPGNPKHVIYVWLDALANYITAIGYGSEDPAEQAKFERYWPADVHLVGKEITRFHCVYWPAFLMAAALPVQKSVVANGWLLFEESKMSKSRGNVVRTETILDAFGEHYRASLVKAGQPEPDKRDCDLFAADVLRYFLLREIPFGQDGSFSFDALITRYNADLANGYGNFVSRTLNMVNKFLDGEIPEGELDVVQGFRLSFASYDATYQFKSGEFDFSKSLEHLSFYISRLDSFISEKQPWNLAKLDDDQSRSELKNVLYTAVEGLRVVTAQLYPFLPYTTELVARYLGFKDIERAAAAKHPNMRLGLADPNLAVPAIFPRADKGLAQIMTDMESPATATSTPTPEATPEESAESAPSVLSSSTEPATEPGANPPLAPQITIDDFAKVDLRVARVLVAERIPKADKLLRLEVDLGFEKRQILAGIAEHYAPETLIGRKVVIVANLAPRKMRGLESNGMIVAASVGPDGAPVLAGFAEDVELGARLK